MVLEQNIFNKKEFLEIFYKKFNSFCEKSPLFLRFTLMDDRVLVYDLTTNPTAAPVEFVFDFMKDEKNNIKVIKDYLVENNYPIIEVVDRKERTLSAFEIQDIMRKERISFAEASSKFYTETSIRKYRVEKVLNFDNRVIVRDLQTNDLDIYDVRIPLTIFVRELFNNPQNASDIFVNKCKKYKQVTDRKD